MGNMESIPQPYIISRLLKTMGDSPGFAGLGVTVQTICQLVEEDGSSKKIVDTVLRDPALTAKLLQIANSSRYPRGAGNVSTIDQVLAIIGLNTTMSVALSLTLLNSLSNKPQSKQLHAEIVAAFFSGNIAAKITHVYGSNYSAQEAQVCGLMQNLGRMMTIFYLYEDIEKICQLQNEQNLTEDEAVIQTLGVSFEEIGVAISQYWELPDLLQNSLAPDSVKIPPIQAASASMAWHQLCSLFCRRITDVIFRLQESREKIELANSINFFRVALRLNEKDVLEIVKGCLQESDAILSEMSFPCNIDDARKLLRKASERAIDMLTSHDSLVQKDTASNSQTPIEMVKQLMRLIHSHFHFDCTLFCLPSGSSGLVAIAGVGRNAGQLTTKLRSSGLKNDIFRIIVDRKIDLFVSDINQPPYAKLIPGWYKSDIGAQSFVMLSLVSEGKLLGIIYGDYSQARANAPAGLTDGKMQEWRSKLIQILKTDHRTTRRITLSIS